MNVLIPVVALGALALGACSRDKTPEAAAAAPATSSPAIDMQSLRPPCEWLSTAEIVAEYGPLTGEPRRVGNAENWGDDADGEACAYPVNTEYGPANLVVQLDLTGAPGFESADEMMTDVIAKEMPPELQGDAPATQKSPPGWDYAGWTAGIRLYRIGHVAILMNVTNSRTRDEPLDRLASLLRGKILDKPFAARENDANLAERPENPCDLITRAEAEAVLGKLSVAPYRSPQSSPLAHGDGPSCSYYSAGHRVFRVRPVYSDGKERFEMAAGLGSLVRSNLGGADAADLLDGPWDSATAGPSGEILFLEDDTLLKVYYTTSSADIGEAAKLAAIAMPRAVKVAANR